MIKMKYTGFIIVILALLSPSLSNAQDGEGLFKAKCNICHLVDKNSTGPVLKGVKAKWEEAGEGEFLYEWVKDPQALVASGKSQMALKAEKISTSAMNAQQVSNEEIDAILDYVDTYVPKAAPEAETPTGETVAEVTYVPNYEQNLNLFYALFCMAVLLLFAIAMMSASVSRFVKSDHFKNNAKDRSNNPFFNTILLVIGFTALLSNNSHALEFMSSGEATDGGAWLKVEDLDIFVMIFINLVLMVVLFYVRRMMKSFVMMTRKDDEIEDYQGTDEVMQKVNHILTDVVPIEEEHTILMHHEYDGIKELDNNLPPWWVWLFYATIAFGVVYIFNYHILKTGDLHTEEYNKSVEQAEQEIDAYRKANAMNVTAENVTLLTESEDLEEGQTLYITNCATCHKNDGEGDIGPNLTDKNWIYGFDIATVFETVRIGTPNGMPAHESKLNPIQLQKVASYVLSMPAKKGAKAQGDIVEK